MRILVYGAGAIGSLLGGYLSQAGHAVTLVSREWHVDAIRKEGLRLEGIWGTQHFKSVQAVKSVDELSSESVFDWIFITVKAYDTGAAVEAVKPRVSKETKIISIQNGLGNYERLQAAFQPEQIALGRIITGVEVTPGVVKVTVSAGPLRLGVPDLQRGPVEAVQRLNQAFNAATLQSEYTESIVIDLWAKVLYNCALNGLATVLDGPYGVLLESDTTRRLMRQIVQEVYAVASASGLRLKPESAEAYTALLFERLIPDTAVHYPSMHADIHRKKPTEIGAMNGAVERIGLNLNVPTPQNALVHRLVREQERFYGIQSKV